MTTETNPLGKSNAWTYHAGGSGGGCSSCGSAPGRVATAPGPTAHPTSFTYDSLGRFKRADFTGTSDYVEVVYDDAGRLTSLTDTRIPSAQMGGGQTYYYTYDSGDRAPDHHPPRRRGDFVFVRFRWPPPHHDRPRLEPDHLHALQHRLEPQARVGHSPDGRHRVAGLRLRRPPHVARPRLPGARHHRHHPRSATIPPAASPL